MSLAAIPGILAASRRRAAAASPYATAVLADSPLLYLQLNETSGASCANSGSLAGSGTCNGTFTRNAAAAHANLGVAVTLGGTASDYISYPDNAALDITGNVTYECWIKAVSFATYMVVMSKGKGSTVNVSGDGPGYTLRVNPSRQLEALAESVALLATSTGTIPNDTNWHHVAFTRSSNTYTFYIDGVSAGTGTSTQIIYSNGRPFVVGGADVGTGTINFPFNGRVDEAAVYNTALSGTRISAHYAAYNA